ncbi:MAG: SGNH/GDSL hydrolase family protein [Hyphomicrobiaceae bacterium]|nr:SGNH/GDSL hydrolase family protein [Hyphomicrobiaceae bacterium]
MRARLGQIAQNCLISFVTLLLCFAVLELLVFRFILVPDDLLPNVSVNEVVRYQPGVHATFRHPDGRTTQVTINADGWNSTRSSYRRERSPGVKRIAVIGDSYVHGAFVDTAEGFPEVLEAALNRNGTRTEVLRFGMDGAPLSQYLHMLRREVRAFKPDLVVVPLIHNDFDESWRFIKTRYASSFMKIGTGSDGRPVEIPPSEFQAGKADLLRNLASFRYLYYETNAYLRLKSLVSRYVWGGNEEFSAEHIQSAVDIRKIADHERNRFAARYVMAEMKRIAEEDGFGLLFAMDGVREAVYSGKPQSDFAVGRLNEIAAELTRELGLPYLDLYDTFLADYTRHGQRLEFAYDWHWNVRANRLVGEGIARFVRDRGLLVGPRPARSAAARPAAGG